MTHTNKRKENHTTESPWRIQHMLGQLDRVMYLAGGRALAGPVGEVITAETLSALYGAPIDVLRTAEGRLVVVGGPEAPFHHGERHPE